MDISDADLVAHSLSDPRSFEALVGRHGARIHAYLARRVPGAADDLLGEVWLAAFEGRHRYDPGQGGVIGWLFGIARYVMLAHLRRERRGHDLVHRLSEDAVDEWHAVDARLDATRVAAGLRDAIAQLTPEERGVLLLVVWEQLTPSEAAQALGIAPGTARSRLHRARTHIRTACASQVPSPVPATAEPLSDEGAKS
ncbi:sigma-70 family RNA polymerase sigma factor [Mumia zhuanghuii]|uniref:Sigma-70 family RNA polymerase sigma factor n=1 Tax=Mumia zhuanghuii TaxID=2585211 RepID=A0A5C4MZH0_9ACTN|nr:sigma-70 family RNA polymerase sigma factor [Mumia zhuanghuii]TNC50310.1 sigma-70 family RNA polymerase sigma factor [Mumia zhuanghuii]